MARVSLALVTVKNVNHQDLTEYALNVKPNLPYSTGNASKIAKSITARVARRILYYVKFVRMVFSLKILNVSAALLIVTVAVML